MYLKLICFFYNKETVSIYLIANENKHMVDTVHGKVPIVPEHTNIKPVL